MATFTITGIVRVDADAPSGPLRVLAFDRDLPSRERRAGELAPIGVATTDADGRFILPVDDAAVVDGELGGPDLSFRVLDRAGTALPLRRIVAAGVALEPDAILFNAVSPLEVDLLV